jgi:hypothetical protein
LAIAYQHHLAVALLVLLLVIGLRFAARRSGDHVAILLAGIVVISGQALPHLAYDVGYLDPHILLLLGLCVVALARRWIWAAAILAAVAPLVHEQFIFYWLPIVAAHFTLNLTRDGRSALQGLLANAALFLPLAITACLVVAFQNSDAVKQAIATTPIEPLIKEQLAAQTFEMSFGQVLAHMAFLWTTYPVQAVRALILASGTGALLARSDRIPGRERRLARATGWYFRLSWHPGFCVGPVALCNFAGADVGCGDRAGCFAQRCAGHRIGERSSAPATRMGSEDSRGRRHRDRPRDAFCLCVFQFGLRRAQPASDRAHFPELRGRSSLRRRIHHPLAADRRQPRRQRAGQGGIGKLGLIQQVARADHRPCDHLYPLARIVKSLNAKGYPFD